MLQPPLDEREHVADSSMPCREEEWRVVTRFPGYEVSNRGRVRNRTSGDALKIQYRNGRPFVSVKATVGEQRQTSVSVAFLVLQAFVGPPPEGERGIVAGFKDGDPENANASNLFWTTRKAEFDAQRMKPPRAFGIECDYGIDSAAAFKPHFIGDNVGKRKLTVADAFQIRCELAVGVAASSLAERYGISLQNVWLFYRRRP